MHVCLYVCMCSVVLCRVNTPLSEQCTLFWEENGPQNLLNVWVFLPSPPITDNFTLIYPEKVRYKVIGAEMKGMKSNMKLVALGASQRNG